MKKLLIIIALFIVAVGAGIGVYYLTKSGSIKTAKSPSPTPTPENRINRPDFSFVAPVGWEEAGAPTGVSVMMVNNKEQITDPDVQKINFKSYFSITYDTPSQENMKNLIQYLKQSVSQTIPDAKFILDSQETINGQPAHFLTAELNQRNVDFKVRWAIIEDGKGAIWVISFNTTKASWDQYETLFDKVANSFSIKEIKE